MKNIKDFLVCESVGKGKTPKLWTEAYDNSGYKWEITYIVKNNPNNKDFKIKFNELLKADEKYNLKFEETYEREKSYFDKNTYFVLAYSHYFESYHIFIWGEDLKYTK